MQAEREHIMLRKVIIFIPSIEKGGVERNAIWVANELVKKGIKTDVIYVRVAVEQLEKFDEKVNLVQLSQRSYQILNHRMGDAINIRQRFNSYLKQQDRTNTIVLSFQSSIVAIGICRRNHIKIICRLSNHPAVIKYEKNMVRSVSEWLKPYYYKKADLVIANSRCLACDFSKKIHKQVETIYNPIDFGKVMQASNEPIEEELQLEADKWEGKLVISVGRLALQKDYGTLIKGISKSRYKEKMKVWILGEGSERNAIENAIEKYGLVNNVRLLGYKSNVYSYMNRASLYIQTSLYEGCPNALIEATAVGLPAIATDCLSGPSEVLLNGEGGRLIGLRSPQQVAEALDEYFDNSELYKRMQEKASEALDKFENRKIMDKYICTMEKLLQE